MSSHQNAGHPVQDWTGKAVALATGVLTRNAHDVDNNARFPVEGLSALRSAGFLGLCVPAEFGGAQQGPRTFTAVVEALAEGCASTAMVYVMHVVAAQAIAASQTLGTRQTVLEAVASGAHLTTLAFSEAGSRSHFWAPVSRLVRNNGAYRTTARKSWVTSANYADSYVANAQAPEAESPLESVLYLAHRGGAISIGAAFNGLGLRGNDSAPVAFDDVRVEPHALLTQPGEGAKAMLEVVLPWFSIGTAAMANGLCRAAVAGTVQHLQSARFEHSNQSLRDFQVLRARLAQMSVRTEASRALLDRTIGLLEQPTEATPLFVLQSRLAALSAAVDVTDLAMKTCGGAAFSRHLPLERLFRDARAGWVMAPTADHLEDFIGRALTGLPLF
jgi:alkylation response protein AidB-like acyl-CoA dehydrogenase